MNIPIVENPTRRKLTRKQLAAGFGGKRRMSAKRRNPGLATLAANPRRRRKSGRRSTSRSRSYYKPISGRAYTRHYRRRRNPSFGGLFGTIDLTFAASVAGGLVVADMAPGLIRKVWAGVPTTGFGGTAVRLGSTILVATGVGYFLKSKSVPVGMVAGAIGYELYVLANQYLLPSLGLSGVGDYMTTGELYRMGISGYVPSPTTLGRVGRYMVTDQALAA